MTAPRWSVAKFSESRVAHLFEPGRDGLRPLCGYTRFLLSKRLIEASALPRCKNCQGAKSRGAA